MIPARILTVAFSLAFLLSLFAATPALAAPSTASANAAPQAKVSKPVVKSALKHDKSPALKSMKPKVPKQGNQKAKDLPVLPVPHNNVKGPTSNAKSGSADVQKSVVTNNMPTLSKTLKASATSMASSRQIRRAMLARITTCR